MAAVVVALVVDLMQQMMHSVECVYVDVLH
jgi:hypothetical protein